MFKTIVLKEILDNISSPKFVFTFLLCTILILLSFYTGINNYRSELKEYNAAMALNKKNLESQPSYGALAGLGTKITKPPQVLSTIIAGVQQAVGRQATVNVAYDPSLVDSKYNSNPVFAIFGELDITLIVKIVLSLLAILFTFDAIVGEKERGTLKLTLSNSVPRARLLFGKATGSFISLMMPLLIPLLLGLIMLAVYPDISLSNGDWIRIGMIFLLFLLYLSVFFALGLFMSSRMNSSSGSFLVLLFIWVTFVIIIPKASVMVAGQINPIPSVHEVTAQKDAFLQEIQGSAGPRVAEWREDNPHDPKNPTEWQEKFRSFLEEMQQDLTAQIDAKNKEFEDDYQAKRRTQQAIALNISRISPASSLSFGAMSLGLTGIHEHERFLNSIKSYKPEFTKWANSKLMQSINFKDPSNQPKPDISDMPRQEFRPENLRDSLYRALPDYAIMMFMIILFFAGAFVSFLKYDVR